MDSKQQLSELVEEFSVGKLTKSQLCHEIGELGYIDLGFAKLDYQREKRTSFPEIIYAEGKKTHHLIAIAQKASLFDGPTIFSRISEEKANAVLKKCPDLQYIADANMLVHGEALPSQSGKVAVVSAGTSDNTVVQEVNTILSLLGYEVTIVEDCGVAGIHRLLNKVDVLNEQQLIIAVAGMEGALPSVLAGLVSCPLIAVPTSVGYGSHQQGMVPLMAMLNSCAPGMTVVNIDNSVGACAFAHKLFQTFIPVP